MRLEMLIHIKIYSGIARFSLCMHVCMRVQYIYKAVNNIRLKIMCTLAPYMVKSIPQRVTLNYRTIRTNGLIWTRLLTLIIVRQAVIQIVR